MRCPKSTYLGIARLPGYRWIINDRGYANVVQVHSTGTNSQGTQDKVIEQTNIIGSDHVWGLVYRLQAADEHRLDRNEGVPHAYTKEMLPTQFWASRFQCDAPFPGWDKDKVDTSKPCELVSMLVYIDRKRTIPDKPKCEYIYRMNQGIKDALKAGVPQGYVEDVMRKYIPAPHSEEEVPQLALKQAGNFEDE